MTLLACADEGEHHAAVGTYRFERAYLDERLDLLEASLRVEERHYDRAPLVASVERMRAAWSKAVLVLGCDGTFELRGVAQPGLSDPWTGTWAVRPEPGACRLLLRSGDEEIRALLGDGWVIPWFEEPAPGMVLDLRLVRDDRED